jgi:PadR family transcriptional regulator, regulatory protein PadR
MAGEKAKTQLLPGTLDLLLLKTLALEPMHGYGIALRIKQISKDVLLIEEGTLYPALQRLLLNGWVKADWRRTENNRRARYYRLTPDGRKQLEKESKNFDRLMNAMMRVMEAS